MNNIKAFIYKDMKRNATFKVLLMFIVGLFLSVNTFAQQIVVKGIVKDTTGEPIIGANVIVKGTTNGTITDFDGNFLLNAIKVTLSSFRLSDIGLKKHRQPLL